MKNGVEKGQMSRLWCRFNLRIFDEIKHDFAYELQLDNPPEDVGSQMPLRLRTNASVDESDLLKDTIPRVLGIINNSRGTMGSFHRQWVQLEHRVDSMSTIFAWFTGFLYATARLTLLALAFAAFRKQDERLYIDTWARFLPSIG